MATIAYDLKVNDDGGLFIDPIKKDFVIVQSDNRHIKEVMMGVPGWNKKFPFSGFNPYSKLNNRVNKQALIQAATLALSADGYKKGINGINFELSANGEFDIKIVDVYRP